MSGGLVWEKDVQLLTSQVAFLVAPVSPSVSQSV